MIKDRKPTNLNICWTNVLELKCLKGPRWIPQSPIQHTCCTLCFPLEIVSGIPITDGNDSAPVPKLIVESWFRAVVIWLSWMRRLSRCVDTIELCEWVEMMMASALCRSDIHPSFAMSISLLIFVVIPLNISNTTTTTIPKSFIHQRPWTKKWSPTTPIGFHTHSDRVDVQ